MTTEQINRVREALEEARYFLTVGAPPIDSEAANAYAHMCSAASEQIDVALAALTHPALQNEKNPNMTYQCHTCGWIGPEYRLQQFDDHNSTSYCCPMCGSTEIYEQDDEDDDE